MSRLGLTANQKLVSPTYPLGHLDPATSLRQFVSTAVLRSPKTLGRMADLTEAFSLVQGSDDLASTYEDTLIEVCSSVFPKGRDAIQLEKAVLTEGEHWDYTESYNCPSNDCNIS